jgi:hypothetical protein
MKTQIKRLPEVRINKANNKNDIILKEVQESPGRNKLKDWQKKMIPNYEIVEIWLDDSIEPIRWQNSTPGRSKRLQGR